MIRADGPAAALVSSESMSIQTMLTLMSARGKSSMIDLRTARAPCRQSGQVGDSRARNRRLLLLRLKWSLSGCNEPPSETTSTDSSGLACVPMGFHCSAFSSDG